MKIPKIIEKVKLQEKRIAYLELREKQFQEDLAELTKWAEAGFKVHGEKLKRLEDRLDKINRKE